MMARFRIYCQAAYALFVAPLVGICKEPAWILRRRRRRRRQSRARRRGLNQ
jgi:hypothetical protein